MFAARSIEMIDEDDGSGRHTHTRTRARVGHPNPEADETKERMTHPPAVRLPLIPRARLRSV